MSPKEKVLEELVHLGIKRNIQRVTIEHWFEEAEKELKDSLYASKTVQYQNPYGHHMVYVMYKIAQREEL